ncbi:MAG: hypothetical protein ACSHWN_04575 [Methylophilaceae bacterium]
MTYRNKEVVEAISWIYDLALSGEISGICFAIKYNRFKHTIGLAGDYKTDPYCAIRPVKRLKKLVNSSARELEVMADLSEENETV